MWLIHYPQPYDTMYDFEVTIILPIYNVAPYIIACLQSIVNQTYQKSIECLLVDDCGTDESMTLATSFVKNYRGSVHFSILRHKRNRGLSAARNTGLQAAKGCYVYFLDSDDELMPDCLTLLTACLSAHHYDFVIGGMQLMGKRTQTSPLTLPHGTALMSNSHIRQAYFQQQWYTMACGKLCKRSFLLSHQLWFKEGLLHEDELWSFQLACTASSMCVVQQSTYLYKVREDSITTHGVAPIKHARAWAEIVTEMVRYSCQHNLLTTDVVQFILDEAYSMWRLFCWVGLDTNDRRTFTLQCRQALSHIPFSLRLRVATSGLRPLIRYANTLMPTCFTDSYYRLLQLNKKG